MPVPPRPTAPSEPLKRPEQRSLKDAPPGRALVHGCGAVGWNGGKNSGGARLDVFTVDLNRERAGLAGATRLFLPAAPGGK